MSSDYTAFLLRKRQHGSDAGFKPNWIPDFLFDFQKATVEWAVRKGRSAIFADCGLGKTPMQLVWAENICRHTNGRVLILTPLSVAHQTIREGEKFGIEVKRSVAGELNGKHILASNYERLHYFSPSDFQGVVCDESSILKSFDGVRRREITEFMRQVPYRLLCTATAAPNDYIELGTSSEALGELGHIDMLNRYFRNDNNTSDLGSHWRGFAAPRVLEAPKWRFKGHAETAFWQYVCFWARAFRKPSDMGFPDDGFVLPKLTEQERIVKTSRPVLGMLIPTAARNMREERAERRQTIRERCEMAAEMASAAGERPVVIWCHLNDEGKLLGQIIPDALEVSGATADERKEEIYDAFAAGSLRVLVTKPKIGAWGLNWQHCADVVTFASHSYEQYYQAVRRCWRFGQKRPVSVHLIATEGERGITKNLKRKSEAADRMFSRLVEQMQFALRAEEAVGSVSMEAPKWLKLRS